MFEVRIRARLWRGKATLHYPAEAWRRPSRALAVLVALASLFVLSATAAFAAASSEARSERQARPVPMSFPARPVRVVVPFPAGGVPDAMARLLAERLTARMGASFEVDNRPSAAGTTAGDVVAKASSDGHTLLLHQSSMLIQSGVEPLPYDVLRDFTPIVRVAVMPLFFVVDSRLPVHTAQQWLAAARANPGAYSIGSGQPGSPAHLYAQYVVRGIQNGVPLVTAKGEPALVQEMLAGRIGACFCNLANVEAHVRNGNLRLLAVTGAARTSLAPSVPTLQESGMDGYAAAPWLGLLAPAKTPRAIVAKLSAALGDVLAEEEVRERLREVGLTPLHDSPDAFATAIRAESIQWQVILRQAGGPVEP